MNRSATFKLRLYVADSAPNGALAIANLQAICRTHLQDRHQIELVDVLVKPERALADGIYMTPTLLKLAPLPVAKIVGTLGQTQAVLLALGLDPDAT